MNRLKNSTLSSLKNPLSSVVVWKRVLVIAKSTEKISGPRSCPRLRLPNSPGFGIAKALGLRKTVPVCKTDPPELGRTVQFPIISNIVINGMTLSWETNIPTTGAVRFNSHQRRMFLGRAMGSRVSLTMGLGHSINLEEHPGSFRRRQRGSNATNAFRPIQ